MKKILVVEDNITLLHMQRDWLENSGYQVVTAVDEPSARKWLNKENFDLVLSDVRFSEGNGIALLEWINRKQLDVPFVIMTRYASFPDAVRAIKLGAKDYLPKPVHREKLLEVTREWLNAPMSILKQSPILFKRISIAARQAEKEAICVAPFDIPVLILGANGTGKEVIAQTIHEKSDRRQKPFITVNCGAIPKDLASSYFFGHIKGSFTGAMADKKGYFEIAEGGTLFLDELGTLPYDTQAMLLRVLQEKTYIPVGGCRERTADVRIVSATNEDLHKAIKEGRFREDLYNRLNGIEIRQPSLSECKEDILPLAEFFLGKYCKEFKRNITGFTESTKQLLLSYHWPGNIRELQHKVKRAILLTESNMLSEKDFDMFLKPSQSIPLCLSFKLKYATTGKQVNEDERELLLKVLEESAGNLSKAAKLLGIARPTLNRRLTKYNLK